MMEPGRTTFCLEFFDLGVTPLPGAQSCQSGDIYRKCQFEYFCFSPRLVLILDLGQEANRCFWLNLSPMRAAWLSLNGKEFPELGDRAQPESFTMSPTKSEQGFLPSFMEGPGEAWGIMVSCRPGEG